MHYWWLKLIWYGLLRCRLFILVLLGCSCFELVCFGWFDLSVACVFAWLWVVNDLFLVWHFCFVVFNYGCGMPVSCCWLCWLLVVGLGFVLVDFVVLVFVACVLFRWACFGFCWCLLMLGCSYFGSVLLTVWFRRCFVYLVVNLVAWCALCLYYGYYLIFVFWCWWFCVVVDLCLVVVCFGYDCLIGGLLNSVVCVE